MSHGKATDTREQHDDFCTIEKWELVRGARGKPVKHHRTYKLTLPDGRVLRTRISRPVDSTQYSKKMWSHILTTQLDVDNDAFWACVDDKILPDRGGRGEERAGLPYGLVRQLEELCGIAPEVAVEMSRENAVQAIADYWTRAGSED